MDISIFLAKVLGLYILIDAIVLIVNGRQMRTLFRDIHPYSIFLSGAFALIFGILIVVSHNVWTLDWRVLITVIGWLALIKGVMLLLFPNYAAKMIGQFMQHLAVIYLDSIILIVVGGYLIYQGFFNVY